VERSPVALDSEVLERTLSCYGDAPHVCIQDLADAARILRPEVNLCVWARALAPELREALEAEFSVRELDRSASLDPAAPEAGPLLAGLPRGAVRDWIGRDIEALAGAARTWADGRRLKASLAVCHNDGCPKLHVDYIGIRILCTYLGPGTEWAPNDAVRREALGRPAPSFSEANRAVLGAERGIQHIQAGHVAWLKGEAWAGNRGNGLVHRSPPIAAPGLKRLVLTIDIPPARAAAAGRAPGESQR
jgi:Protein of unknown function (DUF1826)